MAYYLQMDGVDDRLRTKDQFSLSFDEVLMDCYIDSTGQLAWKTYFDASAGLANTAFLRNGSNQDTYQSAIQSVYVNGVQVANNTAFMTPDQRIMVKIKFPSSVSTTRQVAFFANQIGNGVMKGNIYDIKFINGGQLVTHYDMSTQTVEDQSGNGNHATLTGGTWVDDGSGGGDTGTDVSYSYAMQQAIYADRVGNYPLAQSLYSDRVSAFNTVQNVYADRQTQYPIKQAFYEDQTAQFPMAQAVFADRVISYATEQRIYADRVWDYPMLQQIFSDYILYSADFPMLQVIFADRLSSYPTKQQIYQEVEYIYPMLMQILLEVSIWKSIAKPKTTWTEEEKQVTSWITQNLTKGKFQ